MGREPSVCSSSDDGLPQQEGTKRMKTDTFRESVSVEETNRMREKLGLKPLHDNAVREVPKEEITKSATVKKNEDFNETLSIEETNKLRIELGMKPLYQNEETKESQKSVETEDQAIANKVRAEAIKCTAKLTIDKRISAMQSGNLLIEDEDSGDDFIEPNFDNDILNTHLSYAATNILRESLGLIPLHRNPTSEKAPRGILPERPTSKKRK